MDNPEQTFQRLEEQYKNGTLPPFIGRGSELYELIKLGIEQSEGILLNN
jgi:hypothetical protein